MTDIHALHTFFSELVRQILALGAVHVEGEPQADTARFRLFCHENREAGQEPAHVIELRKRYWLLSIPTPLWTVSRPANTSG